MTERIEKLRNLSLQAENAISAERAILITEFYKHKNDNSLPAAVQRANCFKYIFENKELYYNLDELIVGERGPQPKATPTYPEICLHSLNDLKILKDRPKVCFKVNKYTSDVYRDKIIPFWSGKTNRERIFKSMSDEWIAAYEAGIFTEFQEQRAPGHTVLGDKIYKLGMFDIVEEIDQYIEKYTAENIISNADKLTELKAMKITAETMINYATRYVGLLTDKAGKETDKAIKQDLLKLAEVCRKVPAHKPETFHEALQYYWFVHLGVITELNPWDSFNPGRLDQHLYPFYRKGIEDGSLTKNEAIELLQCFWIKFNNHPSPPKMGVTAKESSTYTDFTLINLGGVKPDGSDGKSR